MATSPTDSSRTSSAKHSVSEVVAAWKEAHARHGAQFLKQRNTPMLWARLTEATDNLLQSLVGPRETHFAVAAVGGYGRGQLFPYSDIDLLIITPDGVEPHPAIERVLYGLWDMPIKVGHAVRSVSDTLVVAKLEHTVMTGLLDLRHVAGKEALTRLLQKKVTKDLIGSNVLPFVEAKLRERDMRHTRALDSRFVLEPNVKEGKGGLRDLHTIWWLARYCYDVGSIDELTKGSIFTEEDAKAYGEALDFLSTVRASLHLMAGRAEERLTFDTQLKLAETYHYRKSGEESAKRFMKHYFRHATRVGELTRSFCTLLEDEKKRKPTKLKKWFARTPRLGAFIVEGERLSVEDGALLRRDPLLILELFAVAQEEEIDIHPKALKAVTAALGVITKRIRESERATVLFKSILLGKAPDITLRRMNEAGVLAKIVPEFANIAGQMQYDRYHTYTVDEHTLVAVANLHKLERGEWRETMPIASDIIAEIRSREALYMAMLTHDIGKGVGKQAERGEVLAREIAQRMHCSESDCELIAWLVRNHLLMSEVAFKRDLDDEQTIIDFAAMVQLPERLRLLLLITVADICAVGPLVWNGWKGALLRVLYNRTMAMITGEQQERVGSAEQQEKLTALLKQAHPEWEQVDAFVAFIVPVSFWRLEEDEQRMLAELYYERQDKGGIALRASENEFHSVTELTLCVASSPQLLAHVAGAAALMGASIVSAKLLAAGDGMSWITIGLQDAAEKPFDIARAVEDLPRVYADIAAGRRDMEKDMARAQPRYFGVRPSAKEPTRVNIDNALSATHSVIEVSGQDRIGFLHAVAAGLAAQHLVIATAHVATYGKRAVDVFYVKDAYGHKLVHPAKMAEVEKALLSAIG